MCIFQNLSIYCPISDQIIKYINKHRSISRGRPVRKNGAEITISEIQTIEKYETKIVLELMKKIIVGSKNLNLLVT